MAQTIITSALAEMAARDEAAFVAYQRKCRAEIAASNDCWKCNGKGIIRGFEHIEHGKCFVCSGTGKRQKKRAA